MNRRLVWILLLIVAWVGGQAAAGELRVRSFTVKYRSLVEASQAVQELLSDEGVLTVQPKSKVLRVQDTPEVVARVARFLASYDVPPPNFRIRLLLLEASGSEERPPRKGLDSELLRRLRKMFRYRGYTLLGKAEVEGEPGKDVAVKLAGSYRIEFQPRSLVLGPLLGRRRRQGGASTPVPGRTPVGDSRLHSKGAGNPRRLRRTPLLLATGPRLRLEHLRLVREEEPEKGGAPAGHEVLRTSIILSAGQRVILGAASSEDAGSALVLVVEALAPEGEDR